MSMTASTRTRLSVMMFLQYAMYGIWIIPMATFLGHHGFSGKAIGWAYSASAIACLVAPFFIGMIADRFFSAERVLAVLNLLSGGLLLLCLKMVTDSQGHAQPGLFFVTMLAYTLCYMPTWALTNSIAMAHMEKPDKEFPGIRVMGTLGWVVVSAVGLLSALGNVEGISIQWIKDLAGQNIEKTTLPMQIGAGISFAAALFALVLPHTPPKSTGKKLTAGDILGVKALALLKEPCFAIFVASSLLITLAGAFYWSFCNIYLNEVKWQYAQFKMSIGQMSEVVFMLLMPLFFRHLGVKKMLLVGMLAWVVRFLMFAFGNPGSLVFMLYIGVALHGVCYDFFFVTGQIYTDRKAPKEVQASAQGFISLITFGIGMLLGNTLAGYVVDKYVTKMNGEIAVMHNWQSIWLVPCVIAGVLMVFFALAFRDPKHDKSSDDEAPAEDAAPEAGEEAPAEEPADAPAETDAEGAAG